MSTSTVQSAKPFGHRLEFDSTPSRQAGAPTQCLRSSHSYSRPATPGQGFGHPTGPFSLIRTRAAARTVIDRESPGPLPLERLPGVLPGPQPGPLDPAPRRPANRLNDSRGYFNPRAKGPQPESLDFFRAPWASLGRISPGTRVVCGNPPRTLDFPGETSGEDFLSLKEGVPKEHGPI